MTPSGSHVMKRRNCPRVQPHDKLYAQIPQINIRKIDKPIFHFSRCWWSHFDFRHADFMRF